MAGAASPVPVSAATRAIAGACAFLCRSLHGQAQATPNVGGHRAGAGIADAAGRPGSVVALNLFGAVSEQPDFLAHRQALPYVLCLRADADWKHAPQKSSGHKVSPLVLELWKALDKEGVPTADQARETLGRELTEAAVLRGLCELWQALRVSPVSAGEGTGAWELLRVPSGRAPTQAAYLPGDRVISAGIHVFAVGLRRLERGNRNFSFPGGVPFASAGSGARLGRHAADPFAFDGCPDVLLPGRWLAGVRRAGGSRDSEYGAPGTGCGVIARRPKGAPRRPLAAQQTQTAQQADAPGSRRRAALRSQLLSLPGLAAPPRSGAAPSASTHGVDGSAPACGQASRERGSARKGCG